MRPAQIFRIWVAALVLLTAAGAQAVGPWYVATNGVDSNDGTSWAVPYLTISNALTNASTGGDTIWVSNGVYTLTATVSNPAAKKFNIRAWSTNPADTVLLGPGSNDLVNFRGVWMSGAGSLLQGFTVTNFYYTNENFAAGVYCSAGLISNCVIAGNIMGYSGAGSGNISANGGGVYLEGGGVVENCSIIGNSIYPANYSCGGGGVLVYGSGQIRNCRIVGNRLTGAANGPGIFTYYGSGFVIRDSAIASNTGGSAGGAISISGGIISNCQIFANSCPSIGGIYFHAYAGYLNYVRIERCVISNNVGTTYQGGCWIDGTITNVLISQCVIVNNYCQYRAIGGLGVDYTVANVRIRNCLVAYNKADNGYGQSGFGGCGIWVASTNALIENCTIVSNTLTGGGSPQGAGLYATNGVRVVNSIIYHNVGVTTSNVYALADCTFSNSCTAPLSAVVGTANTDANPRFVAKDTGNFRLNNNSPCLNTGMNEEWMTNAVDLEGRKRLRYGRVDMGAYERIYEGSIYTVH